MSELLKVLEKRKELSRQAKNQEEDAEAFIETKLKQEEYPVNEVNVVSSYYEFNVVMDSRIGSVALRNLDEVFSEFRVESIHVKEHEDRHLLNMFFKHVDDFPEKEED